MKSGKIVCLCLLGFSFLLLLFLNKKEEGNSLDKAYQELVVQLDSLAVYQYNFELDAQFTGTRIENLECQTEDGRQVRLSDMVENGPVLVYRYADINCNVCIEAEIEVLHKNFKGQEDRVLLLCSYQLDRDFLIFKKINKIRFPFCRIPKDALKWGVEKPNNPYCFVLHPDLKVSNVFVPDKSFPNMNELYLQGIKRLIEK